MIAPAAQAGRLDADRDGGRQRPLDVGHGLLYGRRQRRPPVLQRDAAGALLLRILPRLALGTHDHVVVGLVPRAGPQAGLARLADRLGDGPPAAGAAQAVAASPVGDAPSLAPQLNLVVLPHGYPSSISRAPPSAAGFSASM